LPKLRLNLPICETAAQALAVCPHHNHSAATLAEHPFTQAAPFMLLSVIGWSLDIIPVAIVKVDVFAIIIVWVSGSGALLFIITKGGEHVDSSGSSSKSKSAKRCSQLTVWVLDKTRW
jgi:hypothetical protein